MKVGQIIRAIRKRQGQTLEQLAIAADTDPSNLSRIERGIQQPSAASLHQLAEVLGTSVSELYAKAEGVQTLAEESPDLLGADEMDYTEAAIQLRRLFRKLTPSNQKIAVELLRALNRTQGGK